MALLWLLVTVALPLGSPYQADKLLQIVQRVMITQWAWDGLVVRLVQPPRRNGMGVDSNPRHKDQQDWGGWRIGFF